MAQHLILELRKRSCWNYWQTSKSSNLLLTPLNIHSISLLEYPFNMSKTSFLGLSKGYTRFFIFKFSSIFFLFITFYLLLLF